MCRPERYPTVGSSNSTTSNMMATQSTSSLEKQLFGNWFHNWENNSHSNDSNSNKEDQSVNNSSNNNSAASMVTISDNNKHKQQQQQRVGNKTLKETTIPPKHHHHHPQHPAPMVQHCYHDHARQEPPADITAEEMRRRCCTSTNFPIMLHQLLDRMEADGYGHVISWQPHGRCFLIHERQEFIRLLPKYSKLNKMASFQRQLNLYDFHRITQGLDKGGYYSEYFLRGKLFLAYQIQRIKVKGTGVRGKSNPDQEPDLWSMEWVDGNGRPYPSPSITNALEEAQQQQRQLRSPVPKKALLSSTTSANQNAIPTHTSSHFIASSSLSNSSPPRINNNVQRLGCTNAENKKEDDQLDPIAVLPGQQQAVVDPVLTEWGQTFYELELPEPTPLAPTVLDAADAGAADDQLQSFWNVGMSHNNKNGDDDDDDMILESILNDVDDTKEPLPCTTKLVDLDTMILSSAAMMRLLDQEEMEEEQEWETTTTTGVSQPATCCTFVRETSSSSPSPTTTTPTSKNSQTTPVMMDGLLETSCLVDKSFAAAVVNKKWEDPPQEEQQLMIQRHHTSPPRQTRRKPERRAATAA